MQTIFWTAMVLIGLGVLSTILSLLAQLTVSLLLLGLILLIGFIVLKTQPKQ